MLYYFTPEMVFHKEQVYHRLQIRENTRAFSYVESIFDEIQALALKSMDLLLCYRVFDSAPPLPSSLIKPWKRWVVCLVSCSDRIFQAIQEKMDTGEYLEGYLLNDISNDVIFNASLQLNQHIQCQMEKEGFRLSRRFSPGEPPVELETQKKLLELLLEEDALPVTLNSHYMLQPEKSMLYLFGAGPGAAAEQDENRCASCSMQSCPYATL
ncbi:hypothetical protein [Hominifimenecus sp. rT4P-3]|uniref:hypothetical protein n=1 Tax=Hominifimenecus sp. rT4P-3 TaxID=3242979 RepID=UPI003DA57A8D